MSRQTIAIPTKDVADSMRVLVSTGRFERFAQSNDLLVDKADGSYVYLMSFEDYQKMQKKEPSQNLSGVVAVPSMEEARRALLESGRFDPCPGSDNAVVDKRNGVQISLVPFSSQN